MDTAPELRIGISGWRYEPWRGVFYPEDLPQRLELRYASSTFRVIEINGSFYSLQRPSSWRLWYDETPQDFVFSVKGPRFITHILRLRDFEKPLANFLASGVLALDDKLGPILWQFPPQQRFDPARFGPFVAALPTDTAAALELARGCDARMQGRSHLEIDRPRPLRHAIEVRHESFLVPEFVELLRAHSVALVIAETARTWPMPRDVTADFMYLRLHGDKELYRSGYRPQAIARWADRIRAWQAGDEPDELPEGAVRVVGGPAPRAPAGRDVYCFFDNTDVKLRAPADAQSLMRCLGQTPGTWNEPLPATREKVAKKAKSTTVATKARTTAKAKSKPEAKAQVKPEAKKARSRARAAGPLTRAVRDLSR